MIRNFTVKIDAWNYFWSYFIYLKQNKVSRVDCNVQLSSILQFWSLGPTSNKVSNIEVRIAVIIWNELLIYIINSRCNMKWTFYLYYMSLITIFGPIARSSYVGIRCTSITGSWNWSRNCNYRPIIRIKNYQYWHSNL